MAYHMIFLALRILALLYQIDARVKLFDCSIDGTDEGKKIHA